MPVLLDASFLIAFDNTIDVHHKRAREIWNSIEKGDYGAYFISDYIFDEVLAVAMRKVGRARSIALGKKLLDSLPVINIDKHIFDEAWNVFLESKADLSFTDCTNLVLLNLIASKHIATFDKSFKEISDIIVLD